MGPRFFPTLYFVAALVAGAPAFGQNQFNGQCQATSTPLQVRAEGVTERVGDIDLQCTGATPGSTLAGNLTIYLPVNITNRIDSNSQTSDAQLLADTGSGLIPTAVHGVVSGSSIAFNGISLPAPSGRINLRITGIRASVSQYAAHQPLLASLSSTLPVNQAQLIVAYSQTGLTVTLYNTGIPCVGSPAPSALSLSALFAAGTVFASTRLTEGYTGAFETRSAGLQNGVRFLIRYSGFPANAHVYVPDAVAGSDALVPTSGGDLGVPRGVGQYQPGSSALLLVRVNGADANGAGGFAVNAPSGSGPQILDSVGEVALANGAGYVVYEVLSADPAVQQWAQFPTFISLPSVTAPSTATEMVSLAPLSFSATASAAAPIVRFIAAAAPSDCALLQDCNAPYFPKLLADAQPIQLSAIASGGPMTSTTGYITIRNGGGGLLAWNVAIAYQNGGAGWLFVDYPFGTGNAGVRVWSNTNNLGPGTYQATITINAGGAGSQTFPVTLTVSAAPPPPPPPVTTSPAVTKVVNAATFLETPLVAGSLATVMGTHLSGKSVTAAFDGAASTVLFSSDTQLNLLVPDSLAGKASAALVVSVDGVSTSARTAMLAPAAPAIFAHGVLNQDGSPNGGTSPATAGDVLQIFVTGIPTAAVVSAQVGASRDLIPLYSGAAPSVPGVQQVNVSVPQGASDGDSLALCAVIGGASYCSAPYALALR